MKHDVDHQGGNDELLEVRKKMLQSACHNYNKYRRSLEKMVRALQEDYPMVDEELCRIFAQFVIDNDWKTEDQMGIGPDGLPCLKHSNDDQFLGGESAAILDEGAKSAVNLLATLICNALRMTISKEDQTRIQHFAELAASRVDANVAHQFLMNVLAVLMPGEPLANLRDPRVDTRKAYQNFVTAFADPTNKEKVKTHMTMLDRGALNMGELVASLSNDAKQEFLRIARDPIMWKEWSDRYVAEVIKLALKRKFEEQ